MMRGSQSQLCNSRANALRRLQNLRMKRKAELDVDGQELTNQITIHTTHLHIEEVNNTIMQFLFEKKLKHSDVKQEGRIIIPKAFAEKYMPSLESNYGHHMFMDDMVADRIWMFRFRFWQNNASRVYVLESTGELVKTHELRAGDFIMIYKDKDSNKYGIRVRKCDDKDRQAVILPIPKAATKFINKNMKKNSEAEGIGINRWRRRMCTAAHHHGDAAGASPPSTVDRHINDASPPSSRCSENSNGLQGFPFHLLINVEISDLPEY